MVTAKRFDYCVAITSRERSFDSEFKLREGNSDNWTSWFLNATVCSRDWEFSIATHWKFANKPIVFGTLVREIINYQWEAFQSKKMVWAGLKWPKKWFKSNSFNCTESSVPQRSQRNMIQFTFQFEKMIMHLKWTEKVSSWGTIASHCKQLLVEYESESGRQPEFSQWYPWLPVRGPVERSFQSSLLSEKFTQPVPIPGLVPPSLPYGSGIT